MMLYSFSLCLLISILQDSRATGHSLNAATVLLPILSSESDPAVFDLFIRGEGGCFKVINNRPDVINIKEIDVFKRNYGEGICVRSVRLSPNSRVQNRENSVINFIDEISGLVLNTYAVVDRIASLGFVTRRRVLYIGDNKEKFEVIAYDSLGNMFNSLTGPALEWKILCEHICNSKAPAVFVNFHSSHFEVPEQIIRLESHGLRGNIVLVESIFKGEVRLQVKLADKLYNNISSYFTFSIREYIIIQPSETQYLLFRGIYVFKFLRLVKSKYEEIIFDSKSYSFTSSNNNVTKISQNKNVHAISIGESTVSFLETGSSFNHNMEGFNVLLFVVNPTHAHPQCETQENWVFELNKKYVVNLTIFYMDHPVNVSNFKFTVNLEISKNIINVSKIIGNGLSFELHALKVGVAEISFIISSFDTDIEKNIHFLNPLSTTLQVEVVENIYIEPKIMIVPEHNPTHFHSYHYVAIGGSGRYFWNSQEKNIFPDHHNSSFPPPVEGSYNIFLFDRMSKYIRNTAKLLSLPIKSVNLTIEYLEIPLNTNFVVNVSLISYDPYLYKSEVLITDFSLKLLALKFSEPIFEFCPSIEYEKAYCLVSSKSGCSTMTVSVINSTNNIYKSLVLCSFAHLSVTSSNYITIPGSYIIVNVTGGPASSFVRRNKGDIFVKSLTYFSLRSSQYYEKEDRVESFKFQCLKPGKETIHFSSTNPSSSQLSYVDKTDFTLNCIEPKDLKLIIHPFNNEINCSNRAYVLGTLKNNILFSIYTPNKVLIDDFSDFEISFSSIPTSVLKSSLVFTSIKKNIEKNATFSGEISIISNQYQGKATIILYFKPLIDQNYSFSVSFETFIASQLSTSSTKIIILYYEHNKRKYKVIGGSGNFRIDKNTNIVSVIKKELYIEISPLRLGFETIKIQDICSNFPILNLEVFVTTINRVIVVYPTKERVNSSTQVKILIYSDIDQLISNEDQNLIHVEFKFFGSRPDEIIQSLNTADGHRVYNFFSLKPNVIDFVVEVTLIKNKTIVSNKCQIEFYKNVRLIPEQINMIPGLEVKLKTEGGPLIDVENRFFVSGNCATFIKSNYSLFSNLICSETVTVEIFGFDSELKEVIYSRSSVPLTILNVKRIEIFSINNRFYQSTSVPIHLKIYNERGLVTYYISISKKYIIEWKTEKENHIELYFFSMNGNNDRVMAFMKEEGSSNIICKLMYNDLRSADPYIFTASKLIYILRTLNIFSCQQRIIFPPNSKYDLSELFVNSFVRFKFAETNHPGFYIDSSNILSVPGYSSQSLIVADVKDSRQDIQHSETVTFIVEVSEIAELFFVPINQSSHGLDNLRVGSEINLQLRAIDLYGRFFQAISNSLANITIDPLGIIDVIEFKESILTIKGINLGVVYLFLNSPLSINTRHTSLIVSNPFSTHLLESSVGKIISYTLPNGVVSWKFSNINPLTYKLYNNIIYILFTDSGESELNIQYQSSFYSVLKLKVGSPSSLEFSKSVMFINAKSEKYFFDIIIDKTYSVNASQVFFDIYPYKCSIYSNFRHSFKISESINPLSGAICCVLNQINRNKYSDSSFNISLIVEFTIQNKLYNTQLNISYIPQLALKRTIKTPILVNKCTFVEIKMSQIYQEQDLLIETDITCIQTEYYKEEKYHFTVIKLDLNRCRDNIKSDTQGILNISRELTDEKISIPFVIIFDEAACLHGPIITSGFLFNSFIVFICILFSWVILDRFKVIYLFFIDINVKIKILFDIAKRTLLGPSTNIQISPKVCSLKSDSSLDDGSFGRELYTTRREFLNSSVK